MANTLVKKGKPYFRVLKTVMQVRYKPPRFLFVGEEFPDGSLILSNHEGTDAPMALEMYMPRRLRMWGAHEMNEGLVPMYKYQSAVYFTEKKHWNIWGARAFCLIASPLTNLFYSGFDLISTYHDTRIVKTLKESLAAIKTGESIVIFPEHSEKGYLAELEGFFAGFALFAEFAGKRGVDVPVVVSYYRKGENTYIFDKPVPYSALVAQYETRDAIVKALLDRCNALGKMNTKGLTEIDYGALAEAE